MILLTADEADKVRGFSPSKEGHVLIPIECEDGTFKLGEEVLDAPAFEHVRDFLAKLPRGEDRPAKELTEAEIVADEPAKLEVWSDTPQERSKLLEAAVVVLADEGATLDGLKGR